MKKAYFTIADKNNLKYYEMLKNSLSKFTTDPLILIDEPKIKQLGDPHFFYRATPIIAKALLKDYNAVCKLDADTIITGNLDHIWTGEFDIAVVKNSNPREDKTYPIRLLDVHPFSYANCGLVVMKSKIFVDHWLGLCMSAHFNNFQYREQDLLNLMIFYMGTTFGGSYKVRFLDDSNKWHGLVHKGYWPQIVLTTHTCTEVQCSHGVFPKLVLPKNDEWPKDEDKEIIAIHWAGGHVGKMNYRLHFQNDVCKRLDELVKP